MSDSASSIQKPAGESATQANAVQGVTGGVPIPVVGVAGATSDVTLHDNTTPANHLAINAAGEAAVAPAVATALAPTYVEGAIVPLSVDLSGTLRTSAGGGGGGSSDVAIHDNTTPTQHLGVNASGQAAIQNPPNLDVAASTLATQATLALIKAKTDNLDVALSTRTKPADTQTVGGTVAVSNFPAVQPINDNGGSVTVDGTVTANAGTGTFTTDPVDRAARLVGKVRQTDGTLDLTLLNTAPGSDTGQVAVPVRVISQLGAGSGGGAASSVAINDGVTTTTLATVTGANALKVDGSAVTQPVSGTFWQATQPVSGPLTDTQLRASAVPVSGPLTDTQLRASAVPVSGTVTANQGGTWTVQPGNTANTTAWKVDGSAVTQPVSGTFFQATQPVSIAATVNVQGAKTNNNAAPGATNIGALNVLANAAVPSWTEGNLVTESTDLAGALRTSLRPPVVTGAYRIQVTTAQYTALSAGAVLISFRFTAAALCVVTRVRVFVTTQTAAAAAGRIDRALFVVRSFTVADSGGTAVTLSSPVGKLRTSHAATGVGNIMVSSGNALTTGTGTQDANPVGIMAKAGTATEPIGLTLPAAGMDADLFQYQANQNYPIVLAQNEGLRITIPTAMPSSIAMITSATFEWYEVATANF